jgi:hypothetical protein
MRAFQRVLPTADLHRSTSPSCAVDPQYGLAQCLFTRHILTPVTAT